MLVDTHCHINFDAFDEDREAVLERARQAGVVRILNPGIDLDSSRVAVQLADTYPEIYAAVGVHPNDALTWDDSTLAELRELARHPKVVAIGEIGLDYYWDRTPQGVQHRVFRHQLELAAELGLPVVIHSRNKTRGDNACTDDVRQALVEWQAELAEGGSALAKRPGVLHSYSGSEAAARQLVERNFWIGITGPVTFRNAPELQAVVASLPVERLLIETDAPFLTPHPHRGQRNEPAYVRFIADKIGTLHGLSFDTITDITTLGAERLFHWRVIS